MVDFLLDEKNHDLVLEDGDIKLVSGSDEIKQRLKVTLLAQAGEWLFDTAFGVPYVQEIFVKAPDLEAIAARLRGIIANVEGVTAILELELSQDDITRILTVTAQVDTREGQIDLALPLV
jgi:hypothetical protein